MSIFGKLYPHAPDVVQAHSPAQPPPGGVQTWYRVEGIWDEEGNLTRPNRMVIEMSEGRRTDKPGDVIKLSRLDAAVLSKRHCLVPLFDMEG